MKGPPLAGLFSQAGTKPPSGCDLQRAVWPLMPFVGLGYEGRLDGSGRGKKEALPGDQQVQAWGGRCWLAVSL